MLLFTLLLLFWYWHTGVVSTSAESSCHVLRVAPITEISWSARRCDLHVNPIVNGVESLDVRSDCPARQHLDKDLRAVSRD